MVWETLPFALPPTCARVLRERFDPGPERTTCHPALVIFAVHSPTASVLYKLQSSMSAERFCFLTKHDGTGMLS